MYLRAGYPLIDAADLVCRKDTKKKIASKIYLELLSGTPFAHAGKKYLSIRAQDFSLLEIGERTGNLLHSISSVVLLHESRKEIQEKLTAAFFYPVVILIGSVLLMVAILYGVFPKIIPIFEQFSIEPPLVTKMMVFAVKNPMEIFGGLILMVITVGVLVYLLVTSKQFSGYMWQMIFMLPLCKTVLAQSYSYVYFSNLHMVLLGGGTMKDAVAIIPVTPIKKFSEVLKNIQQGIDRGKSFSTLLDSYPWLFGLDAIGFILLGERAGTLSESLYKASQLRKKELEKILLFFQKTAEPVLLILVAGMVGLLCMSILLPLYKITQGVHG
jgi:type IV pilus assembly protein PilC